MSITVLESDTIQMVAAVCRMVIVDLHPRLAQIEQTYDSAGGVKETLSQSDLDSQPALSGLSKQQMDDAAYALTAVLLPAIAQSYPALSQLAARYRGGLPLPPPVSMP